MKFWKHSLFTALAFFAITSTVLYSACQIDSCSDLKCMNGGSCANGFCNCPTGYEGTQCDQKTADKFLGTYIGNTTCDLTPAIFDTATVFLQSGLMNLGIMFTSSTYGTIYGTISGNNVLISDSSAFRYYRHITVTLEGTKLVVYNEQQITDSKSQTTKTVCTFYGTKQQ